MKLDTLIGFYILFLTVTYSSLYLYYLSYRIKRDMMIIEFMNNINNNYYKELEKYDGLNVKMKIYRNNNNQLRSVYIIKHNKG